MLGVDILPTVSFDELDEFLLELAEHDKEVSSGVMLVGDAAAYGPVWEWGNTRQYRKGPRTVLGTNPLGERAWLSSQAPHGWIRTNEDLFWRVFEQELADVDFAQATSAKGMTKELEKHAFAAARKVAYILKAHAPRDSGQLIDAIQPVEPGDAILDVEADDYGPMEMVGGE